MAHAFRIAKGALLPEITGFLEREGDGAPVNLAVASSVTFVMRGSGAASSFLRAAATYSPAASGQNFLAYYWAGTDTASGGHHQARVEVMFPASRLLIVPEDRWESVLIFDG